MTESKPTITHDPVTWSVLADWYADQGDAEKEAEWRIRATAALQVLKLIVACSWKRNKDPIRETIDTQSAPVKARAWMGRATVVVNCHARGDIVIWNTIRVDPEKVRAVCPADMFESEFKSCQPDCRYLRKKLVEIVDVILGTTNGPARLKENSG